MTTTTGDEEGSITRVEWILLALLVFAAFLVRVAHFDRVAVEHFDEGVYVSNIWFGAEQDFRYPYRHIYGPPLVPGMLEWSMIFFGPGTWGTMLPGLLFGTATVPLAWFASREWFGRWAGWAAASLIAFADQHVLYSRTALVDVPLCFWMLLAVWLIWRAYTRDSWRWAVAAGVATGLAWSTKYNGWLPLAIGLAGGLPWAVVTRSDEARPGPLRVCALWLVVAGVAALVWSPVVWGLQPFGGYAAVTSAQAGYFVGFAEWGSGFLMQMRNTLWTGRALNGVGLCIATTILLVATRGTVGSRRAVVAAIVLLAGGIVLAVFGVGALLLLIGFGILASGSLDEFGSPGRVDRDVRCARWLLAAWFLGLLVATPFYRAYPRLLLPWLVSGWLVAAAGVGLIVDGLPRRAPEAVENPSGRFAGTDVLVPIVGALGILAWVIVGPPIPAWGDRTGLARISDGVAAGIDPSRSVVYTFAEPAAFHHLRRNGVTAVPAGDLEAITRTAPDGVGVFLVVGENARRTPSFASAWERLKDRFELIEEFEDAPSRIVELNLYSPAELATRSIPTRIPVRLYRLKSE